MTNDVPTNDSPKRRSLGVKIALIGAGAAVGVIGATAIGANAQSSSSTAPSDTGSTSSTASGAPAAPKGHGGANPVRSDEKALSASTTAKLKAAALKAVPGGTVYRIESDAGDGVYEAHMTKSDGTEVTVKFDKNLAVTKVEAGMGTGDPAPAGGRGPGGQDGDGPGGH